MPQACRIAHPIEAPRVEVEPETKPNRVANTSMIRDDRLHPLMLAIARCHLWARRFRSILLVTATRRLLSHPFTM